MLVHRRSCGLPCELVEPKLGRHTTSPLPAFHVFFELLQSSTTSSASSPLMDASGEAPNRRNRHIFPAVGRAPPRTMPSPLAIFVLAEHMSIIKVCSRSSRTSSPTPSCVGSSLHRGPLSVVRRRCWHPLWQTRASREAVAE
jgi:hypothetical protein